MLLQKTAPMRAVFVVVPTPLAAVIPIAMVPKRVISGSLVANNDIPMLKLEEVENMTLWVSKELEHRV